MAKNKTIKRQINFEETDFDILEKYAQEKGLGGKWLSTSVRIVIREWNDKRNQDNHKENRPSG